MITQFRVQNFKAIFDVTLNLSPMHVLIGPNDSGKTTLLEAIAALCRSVDHPLRDAFLGTWEGQELVRDGGGRPVMLGLDCVDAGERLQYDLLLQFGSEERTVYVHSEVLRTAGRTAIESLNLPRERTLVASYTLAPSTPAGSQSEQRLLDQVRHCLQGVHYCRWNPRLLALPVAPDQSRQFQLETSGFGLALLLDNIIGDSRDLFSALEDRFRRFFPQVKSIKLRWEDGFHSLPDDPRYVPELKKATGKGIQFEMAGGGHPLPASQASDGMLLVLGYLALLHMPKPPRIILIEEPENGIHPKRLQEVLAVLRELVENGGQTQVLLTTHSPHALDFFKPEEVALCTRQPDGLVAVHPLSESKTVREQLDVFTLGEIWTSEGDDALAQSVASKGAQP